jgi:hypothetical protein
MRPARGRSRIASLIAACALLLGLVVTTPGAAHADVVPPSGGWSELFLPYEPQPGYSLCLDVPSGSGDPGRLLQVYHCHGYASNGNPQRWVFVHISDGSYEIENFGNHLCVTIGSQFSSSPRVGYIQQEPCGAFRGQEWNIVPVSYDPDLYFKLSSDNYDDRCLLGDYPERAAVWTGCADPTPTFVNPGEIWELG